MRILHVTSYQVPGYGYEEILLAQAQHRLGHEVAILTSNYLYPDDAQYFVLRERFPERQVPPVTETAKGVHIFRLPATEIRGSVWINGLARQVAEYRPDVVHIHNLLTSHPLRFAWLKRLRRGDFGLVVDDHTHTSIARRTGRGRLVYAIYRNTLHRLIEPSVDAFAAISEDTIGFLTRECGVRPPIELRPLGVNAARFQESPAAREDWRGRLGVMPADLLLLYTGKVIEPKGPHVLAQATLRLLELGLPARALFVGDPDRDYLASLQAKIDAAGRADRFTFQPSVPQVELPGLYSAADVAIWPRQESMAVLEAMACTRPAIVNRSSGVAFLVERGAGLTFRLDDPRSLAAALGSLLDPATRRTMGRLGRELVEQRYTWERSAERYLETYARACAGKARHG